MLNEEEKTDTEANPSSSGKPFRVICVSMYTEDLVQCDAMVRDLKSSGFKGMSRSKLIRVALDSLDVEKVFGDKIIGALEESPC